MTPQELKARIDAALEANPGVRLVPFLRNHGQPDCNCPLGFAFGAKYPAASDEIPGLGIHSAIAVINGFESSADCAPHHLKAFYDLGHSYRQHGRFTETP